MTFRCPVRDQRLVLDHVVRIGEIVGDLEMVGAVLYGAAQFAEGQFAPLDRIGDTVGSRMIDGKVVTPDGFKSAYAAFVEGGWMTLAAPEQYGGQGLPLALSAILFGRGESHPPALDERLVGGLESLGGDHLAVDHARSDGVADPVERGELPFGKLRRALKHRADHLEVAHDLADAHDMVEHLGLVADGATEGHRRAHLEGCRRMP